MHLPRQQSSRACTLPHDTGRGIITLGWCATRFPGLRRVSRSSVIPAVGVVCSAQPPGRRGAGSHRITHPPPPPQTGLQSPLVLDCARGPRESRGRATPVAFTEIARRDPLPRRLSLATHNNAKTVRQAMESCQTLNRPRSRLSSWSFPDQSRPALAPPPNQMRRLAKTAGRQ
jgi:hypothetical protein